MKTTKIEEIVKIVEKANIAELEVTFTFGRKIKVKKILPQSQNLSQQLTPVKEPTKPPEEKKVPKEIMEEEKIEKKKNLLPIKAPMVGTFYRASAPDAPPYVKEGDIIKKGQVVCIIEAMKLMNEIESEIDGKVVQILVKNAQPVEYGQELFLIEPSS